MKVFVNPGHDPNVDSGAVNIDYDVREADVTKQAGALLERGLKRAGHEVMLLQSDDLDAVVAANDWPADIFVSLHCNASPGRNARGTETLYYSEQGRLLGEAVQKKILSKVPTIDRGCKERQGLYVLRRTVMTAILVELAFIDNNDDLELLEMSYSLKQNEFAQPDTPDETANDAGRKKVAEILCRKIEEVM